MDVLSESFVTDLLLLYSSIGTEERNLWLWLPEKNGAVAAPLGHSPISLGQRLWLSSQHLRLHFDHYWLLESPPSILLSKHMKPRSLHQNSR